VNSWLPSPIHAAVRTSAAVGVSVWMWGVVYASPADAMMRMFEDVSSSSSSVDVGVDVDVDVGVGSSQMSFVSGLDSQGMSYASSSVRSSLISGWVVSSDLDAGSGVGSAGSVSVVVPGVSARLKNVIMDEMGTNTNTNTKIEEAEAEADEMKSSLITKLAQSRIQAKELSPLSNSFVPFAKDNELFYDDAFFGRWTVTAKLKRKVYPYGPEYLPNVSLYEGSPRNRYEKPGDTATYETHYFSSNVPDEKDVTVPYQAFATDKSFSLKVIADRAFNAISSVSAYKQLSQIQDVVWDRRADPTRLTITFSTLAEDLQPLGQKRGEVYISARKSESGYDSSTKSKVYCTSERIRQVAVVPGDVIVTDTETITEYKFVGDDGNKILAISRIAVFLTPNPNSREGVLWQSVGGKAVAFFNYEIEMEKKLSQTNEGDTKNCVNNPEGHSQCLQ